MLGGFEGHMLEVVRQPVLLILLEDRSYILQEVEVRSAFGGACITADVVGQTVGETSCADGRDLGGEGSVSKSS